MTNGIAKLHVIQSPDSSGISCNFENCSIDLPASNPFGLPSTPSYDILDLSNSPCDTLGIDGVINSNSPYKSPSCPVTVWPNLFFY